MLALYIHTLYTLCLYICVGRERERERERGRGRERERERKGKGKREREGGREGGREIEREKGRERAAAAVLLSSNEPNTIVGRQVQHAVFTDTFPI